jgi:mRNA interferase MazF
LNRDLQRGDIVVALFPQQIPSMHEQQGTRPAIIVGVPFGKVRYPLIVVVPLTTQIGQWAEANSAIYLVLQKGAGNLVLSKRCVTELLLF